MGKLVQIIIRLLYQIFNVNDTEKKNQVLLISTKLTRKCGCEVTKQFFKSEVSATEHIKICSWAEVEYSKDLISKAR